MSIAYEGTDYGGWQIQKNASSIQQEIETALSTLLRLTTSIVGSGRTDAGVHAREQVAHFDSLEPLDLHRITYSLNALLPPAIRILKIEGVGPDFHARYSALRKIYHYHLHLHPVTNPFQRAYAYHIPYPLNLERLKEAAAYFLGTHDFTAFSNEAHKGACAKGAVRTLYRLDLVPEEEGIRLEFEGSGFLYKMVRNIVGTLLDVARGKIDAEEIPHIFRSRSRKEAAAAAPAHGLFLMKVIY